MIDWVYNVPVHVALGKEPGDLEPSGIAQLLQLLVVGGGLVGESILGNRSVWD